MKVNLIGNLGGHKKNLRTPYIKSIQIRQFFKKKDFMWKTIINC